MISPGDHFSFGRGVAEAAQVGVHGVEVEPVIQTDGSSVNAEGSGKDDPAPVRGRRRRIGRGRQIDAHVRLLVDDVSVVSVGAMICESGHPGGVGQP